MKKILSNTVGILIFVFILVSVVYPRNSQKKENISTNYSIPFLNKSAKIDGKFSKDEWKEALKIDLKYEIMPGENIKPPVRTEAYIFHNSNCLFVAFKAFDKKVSEIRSYYNDRDHIWQDDTVGIGFDTFNSGNRAYYFSSNPLGIQGDEIFSMGGQYEDNAWDAIWDSAGNLSEFGYIVEMRIPFNAIQFHPGNKELTWGLLLFRNYPRDKKFMISNSSMDRNQSCWICQLPKIIGFKNIKPGKNLEFDPTITGLRVDSRDDFPDGKLLKETVVIEPGISGKWGISSNINLSFAINPDFSQVEADAAQLDINNQFALFFREKRPFFLEGGDFFNSILNVVYTRSVADPDFGVKLTGKEGKSAFGIFVTRDKNTNLLFPGVESSDTDTYEKKNWSSSLRYRLDLGNSSTIGFIVTDREGESYFNRLGGIDGLIKITKSDQLSFQFLGSSTLYTEQISAEFDQEENRFSGTAFKLEYMHSNRNWNFRTRYEDISPDFRADMGFIPQVDFRKFSAEGGLTFWGKKNSFFSFVSIGLNTGQTKDYSGNLIERKIELSVNGEGPLQSHIFANLGLRKFIYEETQFDQIYQKFFFSLNPSKKIKLEIFGRFGDGVDYDNIKAGKIFILSPEITYKLGQRASISADILFSNLNIGKENLFKAFLSDVKFLYHFSKKMFFRGIVQFYDIKRNVELYVNEVEAKEQNVFTQFLFSYKLNPRTVFYLGYSDIFEGYTGIKLLRSQRSLFIKIGYALVM